MAIDFSALKKTKSADSLAALRKRIEEVDTPTKQEKDERFWRPTTGPDKNGTALIRFLDAPAGEEDRFVRLWTHGFKSSRGFYYENSLTSIGQKDPVGEYNSYLWNQGEAGQAQARRQKRKTVFISNILVIEDTLNPEAEGKVFLFRYGQKIYDKIKAIGFPTDEALRDGKVPVDVFNMWEGANFRLRVNQQGEYPSYDDSEFLTAKPIAGGNDEVIQKIWEMEYSLKQFVAPDQFKPYEELEVKLKKVLGLAPNAVLVPAGAESGYAPAEESKTESQKKVETVIAAKVPEAKVEVTPPKKSAAKTEEKEPVVTAPVAASTADEDEDMKLINKLAGKS